METINIKKIIVENGLNTQDVAIHLFPTNKHPNLALNRIIKGEGELNSVQVSKLASLADITIQQAYSGEWTPKNLDNICTIVTTEFLAELNTDTWKTKLFHKKSLFHQDNLSWDGLTPLGYINYLNNIIYYNTNKEKNGDKSF